MNHWNGDSTYSTLWKWASLISCVVIILNGTTHPVHINDPMCRWLAVGSYILVFLAGLWLWMGPQLCASCTINAMHTGMGGSICSSTNQPLPRPKTTKIYIDGNAWNQLFHCERQCPQAFAAFARSDCLKALEPCRKCTKADCMRTWRLYSTPSGQRYHTYSCSHIQNKLSGDAGADRWAVRTLTPCTCAIGGLPNTG